MSTHDAKQRSFELFAEGKPVQEVAARIGRAPSTTAQYLEEFIELHSISEPEPWVDAETAAVVEAALKNFVTPPFKPVFESLGGNVPYDAGLSTPHWGQNGICLLAIIRIADTIIAMRRQPATMCCAAALTLPLRSPYRP